MKKLLYKLYIKLKPNKMKGRKVRLKPCTPAGMPTSNNVNMGQCSEFIITKEYPTENCYKGYSIKHLNDYDAGWVYAHEIENLNVTVEELTNELEEATAKVSEIKMKIEYLQESGAKEFDETEYKVYSTLKLLENNELSNMEKSKIIAELIKQ